MIKTDYRRAFKIACELLNGVCLYGIDSDRIFEIMMNRDSIVTNESYEEYILTHLQELDQGQYEAGNTGEIIENLESTLKILEQEPKTWSLDDAREDFMHDVYNTLDFLPTNNEANRIIDSFDRVTSGLKQQPCEDCISREDAMSMILCYGNEIKAEVMNDIKASMIKLPPVQPKYNTSEWCHDCSEYDHDKHCCPRYNKVIRNAVEEIKQPKTHWISYWDEEARCYVYKCPECGNKQPFDTKHCWECGTKLSEISTGSESEET